MGPRGAGTAGQPAPLSTAGCQELCASWPLGGWGREAPALPSSSKPAWQVPTCSAVPPALPWELWRGPASQSLLEEPLGPELLEGGRERRD